VIDGTGKTMFLKDILGDELENQDPTNLYLYEPVLGTDSPSDFFSRVTNGFCTVSIIPIYYLADSIINHGVRHLNLISCI